MRVKIMTGYRLKSINVDPNDTYLNIGSIPNSSLKWNNLDFCVESNILCLGVGLDSRMLGTSFPNLDVDHYFLFSV